MEKFGGDDIDRMLEAGSYQNTYHNNNDNHHHSYNAVPPPSQTQYDAMRARHGNEAHLHRDRERGRGRGRGRGGGHGVMRSDRDRMRAGDHEMERTRSRSRSRGRGRGGRAGGAYPVEEEFYQHYRRRSPSPPGRYMTREEEERRRKDREQQDMERDQRTVFACQIHPKCDERDIFEFFSDIGKVKDVQLIRDNRTFKSKGLCYVEFEDKASVAQALSLSGQSLGGFPVSVQLTQAEKNRAAQQQQQVAQQSRPMKLYVSNIHTKVTEEDIRPVFSAFGEILSLEIKTDHRHKSKGYGFVEFKKEIDAIGAMQQLNDLEILGQKIKVTAADQPSAGIVGAPNGLVGDADGHAPNMYNNSSTTVKISEESGNGGLALSAAEKQALMQKLGRGQVKPQSTLNTATTAATNAAAASDGGQSRNRNNGLPAHIQTPQQQYSSFNNNSRSRCVLLSNMFDPTTETDPDFDMEIREDVREEVAKFGKLLHIYVDKTAKQGLVYLKFENVNEATKTIQSLSGRWFAKNQIKATYYAENAYNQQFQL